MPDARLSSLSVRDTPPENVCITLDDDAEFTPLAQEGALVWLRYRQPSGDEGVLVTAVHEQASGQARQLLKNEFALRQHLSARWAIRPDACTIWHGRYALIYAPFPFITLATLPLRATPKMADFLDRAIALCEPLQVLHKQRITHGDIKPGNIFIAADGRFMLGGFGLASASIGIPSAASLPMIGGTLAYMSPEHSSRTPHPVNALSDIYSLGIVFYELLTGDLPFGAPDDGQAEWIHHHIASPPRLTPLQRAEVPPMLAAIVLRLLAKSPEHRYQTVAGLLADLRRCQATLTVGGDIASFTPGLQDSVPGRYLTDTLCTTHPQARELVAVFNKMKQTRSSQLVVIRGAQGIGKSSLIASALVHLQHEPALFAVGKAEQYSPDVPYAVLNEAFRSLTLWLLGRPAEEMVRWKARLLNRLGDDAGLAVSLVPELGLLIDRRPAVPDDRLALHAHTRFRQMMQSLVSALAMPGCPLIVLIDDLHWADDASLQLLQHLIADSDALPLMLVVAHREEESLPLPQFALRLTQLRGAATRLIDIQPAPLTVKAIARWLATHFQSRIASTLGLAALIHSKTGGNPLYTHTFFRQAQEDGLIVHHPEHGKWHVDGTALRARHYTDNVASRVLQELTTMPLPTRELLGWLACLGASGDLRALAQMQQSAVHALRERLYPAIIAQLVTLTGDDYAFTHDRVHAASFALIGDDDRQQLHLNAAILLSDQAGQVDGSRALFQAVHHIAAVSRVLARSPHRDACYAITVQAARQAKNSADYASALRYLHVAQVLKQPDNDEQTLMLNLEAAKCHFLQGDLPAALSLCDTLMRTRGGLAEKASAACLLAEVHMRQSDNQRALETTLAWLAVFGVRFSRQPKAEECDAARQQLRARVGSDPYQAFMPLPVMDNPEIEAMLELMASATIFAAFVCPRLHFLVLCRMLHLTLDHGISGASTFALAWYGVLIGHYYQEYPLGFKSGSLARELVIQHDFTHFKGRTLLPLDQVSIWTQPLSYAVDCAKTCFTAAVAQGDLTAACFAIRHQIMNYLMRGDHLDSILTTLDRGLAFVRKTDFAEVESVLLIQRHYVQHLREPFDTHFSGARLLADAPVKGGAEGNTPLLHFWRWLYRGLAHFAAGEYPEADRCFTRAAPLVAAVPGHVPLLDYHFYSALALTLAEDAQESPEDRTQRLQPHVDKLRCWAEVNPGTFADKAALIEAELARLAGDVGQAMMQYEKAMVLSHEGGFVQVNGLAYELAARLATRTGLAVAADAYLRGAIAAWARWGANAKVQQLEKRHPHLVNAAPQTPFDTIAFAQSEAIRDLESVATAARALTEEINLDRLIKILLTMLLERAGAQRCLLLRIRDGDIAETEAWAKTTPDGIYVRMVNETPLASDLPLSVLSAVIRTGQAIRTGRPGSFSPFSQDPYLVTSGAAVMCVPMFKQARLVGVLYLENCLMPDVFTAEHSHVVQTLAAQAAVSLETARLYAELLAENIQRSRVEKDLRASQTSLMLGEQISHTGSWRWELEQDVMAISDEYVRILGLPTGQKTLSMADFLTRVHPEDYVRISKLVVESVHQCASMRAEFRIIRMDGECRYLLGIGDPVDGEDGVKEYFGIITDITAQRQAEDAVRVAQADLARVSRASTVGQLTASIAHEINQPLMSIVANAGASLRWLRREPAELENARIGLEEIIVEGERAGNIIRGLQALTRNQASSACRLSLHETVHHIITLSRSELERCAISVDYQLWASNDGIIGDSIQMQQVLLNLVVNAIEAMAAINDRPRVLTLTSSNPSPDQLRIDVADTGSGIEPAVIARVFDSFYTTKAEGMGMGLTISHGIIERHHGSLRAEPRASAGSVFYFVLPTAAC